MNYNIDTIEGMNNAVEWQAQMLSVLVDGGRWVVPRSGSIWEINRTTRTARLCAQILPDPLVVRVFKASGWKVVDAEGKPL